MSAEPTVVDARGLRCPMPVLELARRVADGPLAAGTTVALLSDDPAAALDVPAWCAMRGHVYLGSEPRGADPADPSDPGYCAYIVRLGA